MDYSSREYGLVPDVFQTLERSKVLFERQCFPKLVLVSITS